jgi:hypothetical protein
VHEAVTTLLFRFDEPRAPGIGKAVLEIARGKTDDSSQKSGVKSRPKDGSRLEHSSRRRRKLSEATSEQDQRSIRKRNTLSSQNIELPSSGLRTERAAIQERAEHLENAERGTVRERRNPTSKPGFDLGFAEVRGNEGCDLRFTKHC